MNTETSQTVTVYELAREIDPSDPGRGVESVIGFLGHLTITSSDQTLSAEDVADVRAAWANDDE